MKKHFLQFFVIILPLYRVIFSQIALASERKKTNFIWGDQCGIMALANSNIFLFRRGCCSHHG